LVYLINIRDFGIAPLSHLHEHKQERLGEKSLERSHGSLYNLILSKQRDRFTLRKSKLLHYLRRSPLKKTASAIIL